MLAPTSHPGAAASALARPFFHFLRCLLAGLLLGGSARASTSPHRLIAATAPGLQEAGSPAFTVLNKEVLGLDSPPTDLHLLPDGRVLVIAARQIAMGDGVRWAVFTQARGEPDARALSVAVDRDGSIYQATRGGFARVEFGEDGYWRLHRVADWPAGETTNRPVPREVIMTDRDWFWHSNSGTILSWRPGQPARSMGQADTVAHLFAFRGDYVLCGWNGGWVTRLPRPGEALDAPRPRYHEELYVTASQPLEGDRQLVGTINAGLQVFDGTTFRPLLAHGTLAGGARINSLCRIGRDYYAVAVENHGVILLDATGRTIQTLDRALDHRLGRVLRLQTTQNGIVWGLLSDGIFRVDFPSRLSHFEPVINLGFETVHPLRQDDRLWFDGDDRALRAVYDDDGHITHFESDMPEGQPISSLSTAPGVLVAGTASGSYWRNAGTWVRFSPDVRMMRLAGPRAVDGEWFYTALNEGGWIRRTAAGLEVRRHPLPGLDRVFNSVVDGDGNVWTELGTGRIGHIKPGRPGGTPPVFELFDGARGVPAGWPQVFVVDGVTRFNISDHILRYDAGSGTLVPDEDFERRFAGLGTIVGRPGRDANDRLWLTTEQGVHIFTGPLENLQPVAETLPPGFQPYYFTFQEDGVVWMHAHRRLMRYDPGIALPAPAPLKAIISHVTLPTSDRTLHPMAGTLPDLPFTDNTLVAHFFSSPTPYSSAVAFDVRLAGEQEWVSAGGGGSALFNQLGAGDYELQVRPRAGQVPGDIARLAFTIHPPWYQSTYAYAIAGLLVLLLGFLGVRVVSYLQRREKRRLEKLVTRRTAELREANARLAAQAEENRTLSQAIQQSPVGVLLTRPDGAIVFANSRVCELSGYLFTELAGRPVELLREPGVTQTALATAFAEARRRGDSWQGQVVNRTKDGRLLHVRVTASPLRSQQGDIALYLQLEEDITESLAEQERRRRLEAQLFQAQKRESLGTLAGGIAHDFNNILTGILGYCELARLTLGPGSTVEQELDSIAAAGRRARDLVSQILSFTRPGQSQLAPLTLAQPVAEALRLFRASTPASVELVQSLQPGAVQADASQIHQVVLNLCTNAAHALRKRTGRIEVRIDPVVLDAAQAAEFGSLPAGEYLRLQVADNGTGMEPAVVERIFDPFFTTKEPGEGTGLGLPIVLGIVTGHRGGLRVRSTPGEGTTFDLVFPVSRETRPDTRTPFAPPGGAQEEILIVDDEPMVADFVAARLTQLGYRTTALNNPRAALEALVAEPRRYAALITDLTMPQLSGIELVEQLQARGVSLPVLIITGYNRNSARADLASVPHLPVLQKPFTGEELAQAVHRVLASRARPASSA